MATHSTLATPALGDKLRLIREPALHNRFVLAPMTNLQSNANGTLGEDEYDWLMRCAAGGFGLVMTCAAHVQKNGQGFPGQLGIWSDDHIPGLSRLAHGLRAAGTVSAVQLHHAGRRAPSDLTGEQPVAPWDDPETGARALSTREVEQVIEDFIRAALRADKAGFDGVELHAAHGYLLGQFLDGDHNQRSDNYGGSFHDRSRVLWKVVQGIRMRLRGGFQIGVRLSPERFGMRLSEARILAEELMTSGEVDYVDMSLWDVFKKVDAPGFEGRTLISCFADLRRGSARLGVAGKIMSAKTAAQCLDEGADFVVIGRGAILHPDFPRRALADPGFAAVERPVSRAYLAEQGLKPVFIDYLASNWPDFVTG